VKVVILAGGLGTRLAEETEVRPKPMVEIGGRPLLWHILKIYYHHGYRDFVIAVGYKGEHIKRWLVEYCSYNGNLTLSSKDGQIIRHAGAEHEDWTIELVDTGLETATGGRIKRLAPYLGDQPFMMTWGDGVANIDLDKLLAFHRGHGRLATVTAVRPPGSAASIWRRSGTPLLREATARRGLDQRRLLHPGAGHLRLHRGRRHRLGARAAGRPGQRRPAHGLPALLVLAVHGHAA
jgi:glucose-1-phosphate cytidylyltransferase